MSPNDPTSSEPVDPHSPGPIELPLNVGVRVPFGHLPSADLDEWTQNGNEPLVVTVAGRNIAVYGADQAGNPGVFVDIGKRDGALVQLRPGDSYDLFTQKGVISLFTGFNSDAIESRRPEGHAYLTVTQNGTVIVRHVSGQVVVQPSTQNHETNLLSLLAADQPVAQPQGWRQGEPESPTQEVTVPIEVASGPGLPLNNEPPFTGGLESGMRRRPPSASMSPAQIAAALVFTGGAIGLTAVAGGARHHAVD